MNKIKTGSALLKSIRRLTPKLIPTIVMLAIMTTIKPYFASTLLALIVNALYEKSTIAILPLLLALLIGGTFIINVAVSWITGKVTLLKAQLHQSFSREVTTTLINLDYAKLESPEILSMRTKGIEALTYNNTLNKVIDGMFSGILNILFASVFTIGTLMTILSAKSKQTSGLAMFTNSAWYGLILIAILVIPIGGSIIVSNINRKIEKQFMASIVKFNQSGSYFDNQVLLADDSGAVLRAFGAGKTFLNWINDKYKIQPQKILVKTRRKIARNNAIIQGLIILVTTLVYGLVILKAESGAIKVGSIILYVGYLQSFINIINGNVSQWNDASAVAGYMKTLIDFINLPVSNTDTGNDNVPVTTQHTIKAEHVWFRYSESSGWILKDISFTLTQGESIALVGRNGSGKTTLIKLLSGLYQPTRGKILFDGKDISKINLSQYWQQLSVVFQDFILLAYSIAENVAASDVYNPDSVWQALKKSDVENVIKKQPETINTPIGKALFEDGTKFSGGESQKIAIARAHYKDAGILFMDEPTAALDPKSEYEIYQQLNKAKAGRLSIFVSHRMGSCRFCNRILVLDNGQIIQEGNHESLINQEGLYSQLFNAQAQYYQNEGLTVS